MHNGGHSGPKMPHISSPPSPPPVPVAPLQMYYDDLPVWGFIGKVEKVVKTGTRKYFLFTHFHFEVRLG